MGGSGLENGISKACGMKEFIEFGEGRLPVRAGLRSMGIVLGAAGALLVVFAVLRLELGSEIDVSFLLLGLIALMAMLYLVARHPAAWIAPMLFAPRATRLPILDRFAITSHITELEVTSAVLGAAVFLRLLWLCQRPGSLQDRFRGQGKAILAYLFFAAVLSFSYLYTPVPDYGSEKLWRFLVFGSLLFFGSFLLMNSEEDFRDLTVGTVVFALAVGVSSFHFSHQGRLTANENVVHIGIGQLIGLAILLLLFYRFRSRRLRRLALLIGVPVLAVGLVSAETRGAILALILGLASAIFTPRWKTGLLSRKQALVAVAVVLAAVFAVSVYWFRGASESKFQYKITELAQIVKGSTEAQGTATERLTFYKAALRAIPEHPLLGWGIGGWSMYYWHEDYRFYPHNLFLEIGVEQGSVGLIALGILLSAVFLTLRQSAAAAAERFPALLPVLVYLLAATMFSGDIDDNRFLWFWCGMVFAACGLALASTAEGEGEREQFAAGFLDRPPAGPRSWKGHIRG